MSAQLASGRRSRWATLSRVRRIFALTWSASPRMFVLALLLTAAGSVATGALAVSLRMLINGGLNDDFRQVAVAAVVAGLALGMDRAGGLVRYNLQVVLTARTAILFERQVVESTATAPGLGHMEQSEYYDRVAWLRDQGRSLADTCWAITESVALVVNVLISVALLVTVHPGLAALPLFAVPSLWLAGRASRISAKAQLQTQAAVRLEGELTELILQPGPAKETRMSGADAVLADRSAALWKGAAQKLARAQVVAAAISLPGWLLFAVGYVGALLLVILRLRDGGGSPGDILLVIALANRVRTQVRMGADRARQLSSSVDMMKQYEWLTEVNAPASAQYREAMPAKIGAGIELNDVSFRYPGTEADVLKHINLDFKAGSVVALVGENGAGKTTLVKLLSRFYEPTEGAVLVDGRPAGEIRPEEWREAMSAAFQDFYRFQILARESVGVGDLPRADDNQAVLTAVSSADAKPFLDALPRGLDSYLGTRFAGATDLSGGQWQRVALARMTMRSAPLLLVLDEPTAALDAFAESLVFDRYIGHGRRMAEESGAITLLVTHRFSTVRDADLIVVLERGAIADRGTHAELMSRNGLYKELYTLQQSGYSSPREG